MVIKKLDVFGFGKFINKDIEFDSNINLIYGDNEAGKSTIHHFMKSMMDEDESCDGYLPWFDEHKFGGRLIYETKDGLHSVEKNFLTGDMRKDKEIPDINLSTFKLTNFTGKNKVSLLKQRLVNKTATNDEELDINDVIERIDREIKSYEEGFKHRVHVEKEIKKAEYEELIEKSRLELKKLYIERELLASGIPGLEKELKELQEGLEHVEKEQKSSNLNSITKNEEKINELSLEVKSLDLFSDTNLDDYDNYTVGLEEIKKGEEEAEALKAKLEELCDKEKSIEDELDVMIEADDIEGYLDEFELEVGQYNRIREAIDSFNEEIELIKEEESNKLESIDLIKMESDLKEAYKLKLQQEHTEIKEPIDNLDKLQSKKTMAAMFSAGFLIASILMFVLAGVNRSVPSMALTIIGVFMLLAALYNGYRLLNTLIQISNTRYRMELDASVESEEQEDGLLVILEEYGFDTVEELESYFVKYKEQTSRNEVMSSDVENLLEKVDKYDDDLQVVKGRILSKIKIFHFNSKLDNMEELQNELRDYRNKFIDQSYIKEQIEGLSKQYENVKVVIKGFKDKLNSDRYSMYNRYSLKDIHEFKNRRMELNNEIASLKETNHILEVQQFESREFNLLAEKRYMVSVEYLEKTLILQTLNSQIQDTQRLIKRLSNKVKVLRGTGWNQSESKTYKRVVKLKELLVDDLESVKVSLYPLVNRRMNKLLFEITGRYKEIRIDDEGDISLKGVEDEWIAINDLSLGTIDQIYFVIGLTMIESTYDELGTTPLVLDDAFIQYDDERFKKAMDIICKLKRQIIIYTCYEREYEYLSESGISFNYIELEEEEKEEEGNV